MIDFKLAKALKVSGFPQNSAFVIHLCKTDGEPFELVRVRNADMEGYEVLDTVDAPLLSELIHECGDAITLTKLPGSAWQASNGVRSSVNNPPTRQAAGKTPEEAFAHLWLVSNQK